MLAKDKTTSEMGFKKITAIINKDLKEDANYPQKETKIHFSTVCRYLRQYYGRPRKIRKSFFLSEEQKKKRVDFCKKVLEKNIDGKCIFFLTNAKLTWALSHMIQ